MPKSKAEESALKILEGVRILQELDSRISLIGLDKGVYIGPGPEPTSDKMTPEIQESLRKLGFGWSEEQESWEFYTGHG